MLPEIHKCSESWSFNWAVCNVSGNDDADKGHSVSRKLREWAGGMRLTTAGECLNSRAANEFSARCQELIFCGKRAQNTNRIAFFGPWHAMED